MKKDVMIVTGAGQISMAIARRTGFGKKIVLGDKNMDNCNAIAKTMADAGFDVKPFQMDLSSRESILAMIDKALGYGEIKYMVNGAGVSPSQAPIEAILKVDLYGTAVLLEEVGKVIAEGGAGITISSQSGWRMPQLSPEEDRQLANGPRGDFYKNMFAKCPAGRPGTADEMATIAEFLLSDAASFVTGSTFLADGGATASYYYGSLQPEK